MWYATVAIQLKPRETKQNPKALEALQKAWDKYTERGAWDLSSVRPQREVEQELRSRKQKAHFDYVHSAKSCTFRSRFL